MPGKRYKVTLTEEERRVLNDILNRGKHNAQKRKRAQALLLAEEGYTDEAAAERVGMSRQGLEQLRERFVEKGFEPTLEGVNKGHRPRRLNGEDEARLAALVCSPKPEGHERWTLRLLAEKWTTLANTDVKTVSRETVFGQIKGNQGYRRFLLRGTEKVSTEWGLLSLGYNLKQLYRMTA